MSFAIRFPFTRADLLKGGSRGHDRAKILSVNAVEFLRVGKIVQIDGCGHDLAEIHSSLFQIIQLVAHGLAKLGGRRWGVDSAVRSRDKAAFGRTI